MVVSSLVSFRSNFSTLSSPKSQILAIHGIGTHSGWFTSLSATLASRDIATASFDLPGFGSEGQSGHVDSYRDWIQATERAWQTMNHSVATYLLGHSLGGIIALAASRRLEPAPRGLILSVPALMANPTKYPPHRVLYQILRDSRGKLHLPFTEEVLKFADRSDQPLDKLTSEVEAKVFLEVAKLIALSWSTLPSLRDYRLLMLLAGKDRAVLTPASKLFFALAPCLDRRLVVLPDAPHDLLIRPDTARAVEPAIADWIEST